MKTKENKRTPAGHRFILDEEDVPWEVGPGYLRRVGSRDPLGDEHRALSYSFIMSGASDTTREVAERRAEEIKART